MATAAVLAHQSQRQGSARLLIVEAPSGGARRHWLEQRMAEMALPDARTWIVSCDFDLGGPWAGAKEFLQSLAAEVPLERDGFIQRHALELGYPLPQIRKSRMVESSTLTDLAPADERTRNYPADRAFRIVHGLIDFVDAWKRASGTETPWIIACDDYSRVGAIGARFFSELMRRRGEQLNIRLLLAVDPGCADAVRAHFDPSLKADIAVADLPADAPPAVFAPDVAARRAQELEEKIGDDPLERQIALPALIRFWEAAGRPDKLLQYRYFGLETYHVQGLYADGLRYGEGVAELAVNYAPDKLTRWRVLLKLLNSHTALQDAKAGLQLAEGEAAKFVENERPLWRGQLLYLTAMLYARHSKPRDLPKGEEYLDRGLALIEQDPDLSESERHFHSVFNRNGLAMIRNFQGRYKDAIELCRSGVARLNAHLSADKHRLHRSVLVYNIGQVCVALGFLDEAIQHYSDAMQMDPNYSEYYNDRAGVFLRLGRLEEAHADYLKAIELSAPYFEVFTNLGQCRRRMGDMEGAVAAYSRALDLEPNQLLALLGRAKANEELGRGDAAIADYSAALSRDPAQWEALASRGILYYEAGDLPAALSDFDQAIKLKAEEPGLYQNRAVVLADLGRHSEAAQDLQSALKLVSEESEAASLRERLDVELRKAS